MKHIEIGIGGKVLLINGVTLVLFVTALLFIMVEIKNGSSQIGEQASLVNQQVDLVQNQKAQLQKQDETLVRLGTANLVYREFSNLSYWVCDLALSFQNEASESAEATLEKLNESFDRLAVTDQDSVEEIQPMVTSYYELMSQALDSYLDENRVLGNSQVAEARNIATQVSAKINELLLRANEEYQLASAEVKNVGDQVSQSCGQVQAAGEQVITGNSLVRKTSIISLIGTGIVGIVVVILCRSFSRGLTQPLRESVEVLETVAEGDLTQRLTTNAKNEIGRLSQALNKTLESVSQTICAIGVNADNLGNSSNTLNSLGEEMSANADQTSTQANKVSDASTEITSNVQSVATAIEELDASIREIAQNANKAAEVARTGVGVVEKADTIVTKLNQSSNEIGNIIKVITSIAEQTNLLALNATIEAARAGDAGKGFAVVANEVKELAKETGNATEDIGQKILTIQNDTAAASESISSIHTIIKEIDDFQTTIASAVEEQTATTNEISMNISGAAESSDGISRTISEVASAANNTTQCVNNTRSAAEDLSKMAEELQSLISMFKYDSSVSGIKSDRNKQEGKKSNLSEDLEPEIVGNVG